jgi:hypothetical protein
MAYDSLLSPELLKLLNLLTTEVKDTVSNAQNNYAQWFEPNSEHVVRLDSTHIENMGLAITPPTQPQPQT